MYGREGPDGLVRDIPFEGALEKEPDGKIKPGRDQCDTASPAPFSCGSVVLEKPCLFPFEQHTLLVWCECLECAHINAKR